MAFAIRPLSSTSVAIDYVWSKSNPSRKNMVKRQCVHSKIVKTAKNINNTTIYSKKKQLAYPIPLIFEEYKAGKAQNIIMLWYSKDKKIRENPPEVAT